MAAPRMPWETGGAGGAGGEPERRGCFRTGCCLWGCLYFLPGARWPQKVSCTALICCITLIHIYRLRCLASVVAPQIHWVERGGFSSIIRTFIVAECMIQELCPTKWLPQLQRHHHKLQMPVTRDLFPSHVVCEAVLVHH